MITIYALSPDTVYSGILENQSLRYEYNQENSKNRWD